MSPKTKSDLVSPWGSYGSNGYRARLAEGLELSVWWEGMQRLESDAPHWNVTVFGVRLPEREASPEAAKTKAQTVARMWLTMALQRLGRE